MDIKIFNEGASVKMELDCSDYPLNATITLSRDFGSEVYARLLAYHMKKQLNECIESIRDDAYNAGYRDGRAKRAKRHMGLCSLTYRYWK